MTANCDPVRERFELPGFVSENRPEFEKVRSISSRSERPLYFARYRHDKPNLGLLEQTPLADQVIVSVELRPFRPINVFCDGHHTRKPASESGAFALYDMRRSWCADIRDPFDTLQVFLPINSFRDFAAERRSSFLDFRYDLEEPRYDAVMLHLMQAMLPALERPREVSALYLGSMFLAVRDHIAEAYGDFTTRASSNRLGLTARQLRHALEYIEANLSQDVSLADVANASATSVSSLTRGFKTALGISPHRWVLNRRIALAQRLIYESATPLNEVAATCGFADQSHLTRVFMRNIGSSPAVWRRRKQTEQDAGVLCSKGEEGGEPDACATTLPRNDAPIQRAGNDGSDVNGSDCEIACEADRRSVRQSNKISGFKPNGFVDPSTESQQWPETSAKHKKQLLRSNWKDQSPPASIPPDM